jgi:hypothetical protein
MAQNIPHPTVTPPYQIDGEASGITQIDAVLVAVGSGSGSPTSGSGWTTSAWVVANLASTWVATGNFPAYRECWSKNPYLIGSQSLRAYAVAFIAGNSQTVGSTTLSANKWYCFANGVYVAYTPAPSYSASWTSQQWSPLGAEINTPTAPKFWTVSWSTSKTVGEAYAVPASNGVLVWSRTAGSTTSTFSLPVDGSKHLVFTPKNVSNPAS